MSVKTISRHLQEGSEDLRKLGIVSTAGVFLLGFAPAAVWTLMGNADTPLIAHAISAAMVLGGVKMAAVTHRDFKEDTNLRLEVEADNA